MKNIIIVIVIALLAIVGVVLLTSKRANAPRESISTGTECEDQTGSSEPTVIYTSAKQFIPNCVRIKAGAKITWQNDSDATLAVAIDPHPTHTGNKEISGGAFTLDLDPSSRTAVTISTKGTNKYHDHNNPNATGTVIAE